MKLCCKLQPVVALLVRHIVMVIECIASTCPVCHCQDPLGLRGRMPPPQDGPLHDELVVSSQRHLQMHTVSMLIFMGLATD